MNDWMVEASLIALGVIAGAGLMIGIVWWLQWRRGRAHRQISRRRRGSDTKIDLFSPAAEREHRSRRRRSSSHQPRIDVLGGREEASSPGQD